jgi:hypothetical protein
LRRLDPQTNFFEIAFDSSVSKLIVCQILISSEIVVGKKVDDSPDNLSSFHELAVAVAPVGFRAFPFDLEATEVDLTACFLPSSHGRLTSFEPSSSNSL